MTPSAAAPGHAPGRTPGPGSPAVGSGPVIDLRHGATPLGDRPVASLSPSRAGDFLTCPLLYRLRSIDRLPEPPGPPAARGTLVHAVLERLFDRPAITRTPETAVALVPEAWDAIMAKEPHLAGLLFGRDGGWVERAFIWGAFATFLGYLLGLWVQAVMMPGSLGRNRAMVRHLGIGATFFGIFALLFPWLG